VTTVTVQLILRFVSYISLWHWLILAKCLSRLSWFLGLRIAKEDRYLVLDVDSNPRTETEIRLGSGLQNNSLAGSYLVTVVNTSLLLTRQVNSVAELLSYLLWCTKLSDVHPSLPTKMRRDATGRMRRAVKTAQSGWRSPAISSRNSNTSNAYKKRFPPEHNSELSVTASNHIHSF